MENVKNYIKMMNSSIQKNKLLNRYTLFLFSYFHFQITTQFWGDIYYISFFFFIHKCGSLWKRKCKNTNFYLKNVWKKKKRKKTGNLRKKKKNNTSRFQATKLLNYCFKTVSLFRFETEWDCGLFVCKLDKDNARVQ